jgi:hypothetical protein
VSTDPRDATSDEWRALSLAVEGEIMVSETAAVDPIEEEATGRTEAESVDLPKMTREYLDSVLKGDVGLQHLAQARLLLESGTQGEQKNLAAEYYPALLEQFNKQRGPLVRIATGENVWWGVCLLKSGVALMSYPLELMAKAPIKWGQQVERCRALLVESEEVLKGQRRYLIVKSTFSLLTMLFAAIDGVFQQLPGAAAVERLEEIATYVEKQSEETARSIGELALQRDRREVQQIYLFGMIPGLVLVGAIVFGLTEARFRTVNLYYWRIAIAAGAVGALLSVMARTARAEHSKTARIDDQAGKALIFCAGAFRPIVGALLGLALYVFVESGLLPLKIPGGSQAFYFLAAISFLAGFSERLAQDTLVQTSRTIFVSGREKDGSE